MQDVLDRIQPALEGRYTIEQQLGRGGMGIVFLARDVKLDRQVAIKVLRPELAQAVGAARFLREVRIEASLDHPNIVGLYDSGEVAGIPYYVMQYVEGESLRDRLSREEQLSEAEALRIVGEVAEGLSYAHGEGVVHRDIKPENILLSGDRVLIADFGIAKATQDAGGDELTTYGIVLGTPEYMSPEQSSADKVDGRTDIYALGCVLYEMLSGDPPYTGRTRSAVIARHLNERIPSVRAVRPGLSPAVADAIETALSKVPADRYAVTEQFVAALSRAPGDVVDRTSRGFWATRQGRALGAAAAVAILALASWLFLRPPLLALEANKVVVFPLTESGLSESQAGMGLGVAYLISAALEHADPLKLIDVTERLSQDQLANPRSITAAEAQRIARERGAASYVRGVLQGHGDSATVILRLHDAGGDSVITQQSATGARGTTPLHRLGIDAVLGLLPALVGVDPEEVDLSPLRDRQTDAIALFMRGEGHYRRSQFRAALDNYRRAVRLDSAFALAAVKGAQAASWNHLTTEARELVDHALLHDTLLPNRYVHLTRGVKGYLAGSADSALHALSQAVAADSEWAEAHHYVGEVLYHLLPSRRSLVDFATRTSPSGSIYGVRPAEASLSGRAERAFATALRFDSTFTPPLFHLAEVAIRQRDRREASRLVERFAAMQPDTLLLQQLTLMSECAFGDGATVDWDEVAQAHTRAVFNAAKSLSAGGYQVDCAEQAFRASLRAETATAGERWGAFLALRNILELRGQTAEAVAMVDSVIAAGKGVARTLYVLDALDGWDTERQAAELEEYARQRFGEDYENLSGAESLWVMAVWNYHQGNAAHADAARHRLDALYRERGGWGYELFGAAAAAHATLAGGDTAGAVAALAALPTTVPGSDLSWDFAAALPVERLLLAELLFAGGRYSESYWAATVFDHPQSIMFLPYLPRSLVIRYLAARQIGTDSRAEASRDRLVQLGREDLLESLR